jgi:broad-specificity NMP kinase
MLTIVLGAPGSGKSTIRHALQRSLPAHVVIDWDDFMSAAEALSGRDVRHSPDLWPAYRRLLRAVVDAVDPRRTVVLGVCTPDELNDWPPARWFLLDCDDDERRSRLAGRSSDEVEDAVADGRKYRSVGLPAVATSGRTPDQVANELASVIGRRAQGQPAFGDRGGNHQNSERRPT